MVVCDVVVKRIEVEGIMMGCLKRVEWREEVGKGFWVLNEGMGVVKEGVFIYIGFVNKVWN